MKPKAIFWALVAYLAGLAMGVDAGHALWADEQLTAEQVAATECAKVSRSEGVMRVCLEGTDQTNESRADQ
ncbi:MAG: hypothetical protein U5L04_02560 [Trueperaceae bacterium]|nr:hypothetical protein [Trueperaceae bacterium]